MCSVPALGGRGTVLNTAVYCVRSTHSCRIYCAIAIAFAIAMAPINAITIWSKSVGNHNQMTTWSTCEIFFSLFETMLMISLIQSCSLLVLHPELLLLHEFNC